MIVIGSFGFILCFALAPYIIRTGHWILQFMWIMFVLWIGALLFLALWKIMLGILIAVVAIAIIIVIASMISGMKDDNVDKMDKIMAKVKADEASGKFKNDTNKDWLNK